MLLRSAIQALIFLVLAILAAVLTYFYHPNRPALYLVQEPVIDGEISVREALAGQAAPGVLWIDARQRQQFEKDHVPGAILLNEMDFSELILDAAKAIQDQPDKLIVVYCDAKKCEASRHIAEELRAIVPNSEMIRVLHGGYPAWQAAQGK